MVSGRRVAVDRLVRSALTNAMIDRDHVAYTDDGRPGAPADIGECEWTGARLLISELDVCRLTGLRVNRILLSRGGELAVLRDLLDGKIVGDPIPRQTDFMLPQEWSKAQNLRVYQQQNVLCVIVLGELRAWLGLQVRHAAAIWSRRRDAWTPQLIGTRRHGVWQQHAK